MTKVSKHMSDLIPTLRGLKGKYWGYFPSKVETANTKGMDWNAKATRSLKNIGYDHIAAAPPKEIFEHIVTKVYFSKTDEMGKSVVELTQYDDNGYTWTHVCVSGDAGHGIEVWKELYGDDVYERKGGEAADYTIHNNESVHSI